MSKSLKNFITIDVGAFILRFILRITHAAGHTGDTSEVHSSAIATRIPFAAMECEDRFF